MEAKIVLAVILLCSMAVQDIRHREINNWSWAGLVAIGFTSFLLDLLGSPTQITATLFAFSLFSGMLLGFSFYLLGWLGGGDALAIIGLSTVTYDFLPVPFIFVVLLPVSIIGLGYALLQDRFENKVDVPYTLPILLGFLVAIAIF